MSLSGRALRTFVADRLVATGSCYFHCRGTTVYRALEVPERVVAVYHCRPGYVSRVVYYDGNPDLDWFVSWLRSRVHPLEFRERDVRVATRHPWEFGQEPSPRGGLQPYLLRQVYWTQPRPQGRSDERVYLCVGDREADGCGAFFVQTVSDERPLCSECLSRRRW